MNRGIGISVADEPYGVQTYKFKNSALLRFESAAPEITEVSLESTSGLREKEAIEKLKSGTKGIGFNIDFAKPEVEAGKSAETKNSVTKTFWDKAEGTIGRAFLRYNGKKLIAIGYGMAL